MKLISLAFSAFLIDNVVLSRFLGVCPFIGLSKNKKSSIGMGFAVTFVIFITSILAYLINKFILVKFEIEYLKTIIFILVIASIVQILEMIIKKYSKSLYNNLGLYLPLITTNCAVLGMSRILSDGSYLFYEVLIYSLFSGLGFLFVIYIFQSLRERLESFPLLKCFKGVPIALIVAGIMALIFSRFKGVA